MKLSTTVLALQLSLSVFAQPHLKSDTTRSLSGVVVQAYQYNRPVSETPVALGIVTGNELNRFNNTSLVSTVNTIPGVRMEERSPGSYRFSVRGSSLRSPFGVRNVKFYWNGLPLTDGGGNTYLNLIDFDAVGRMEILKGPGASLYGANTSGVVLMNTPTAQQNRLQVSAVGGSFGLQRYQTNSVFGNDKHKFFFNYAHQQSDGYRQQSAMQKNAFNAEGKFSLHAKSFLSVSLFYTDLNYQTPGGLSLAQYSTDPQQASTINGSAVAQKAAVYNKTIYASSSLEHQWSAQWSTRIGVYGSYTDFTNPAIANYKREIDQNLGGRMTTQYELTHRQWKGKLNFGAEYQYVSLPISNYTNLGGTPGNLQTNDHLQSNSAITFAQLEVEFPENYFLTIGGSGNFLAYHFDRTVGMFPGQQQRNFDPVFSPRLAALKKITDSFSLFGSVSKGFSAPALAEVLPSSRIYNNNLSPEQGINYELGLRGNLLKALSFDVVAYDFELTQAIVDQKNIFGDYFINTGNTSQKGIETFLSWQKIDPSARINYFKCWVSSTITQYKFVSYVYNNISYSGKQLTGSPSNTTALGADASVGGFYVNVTATYVSQIPLNNANSVYASDYFLAGARIGYKNEWMKKTPFEFFAGVDNVLDQKYSLGNDINAVNGLYFNAAAPRNFYLGIKIIPKLN